MRVQPTSGVVTHGALHTGVTATFVTGRAAAGYDRVANTADVRRGIPDHLSVIHRRRDFARVVDVFYANGPAAAATPDGDSRATPTCCSPVGWSSS